MFLRGEDLKDEKEIRGAQGNKYPANFKSRQQKKSSNWKGGDNGKGGVDLCFLEL